MAALGFTTRNCVISVWWPDLLAAVAAAVLGRLRLLVVVKVGDVKGFEEAAVVVGCEERG